MSDLRIAVPKSPKRIRVRDGEALLEHAKVLQLRSQSHDLIDQELRPAEQRVDEAKLKLREAEVAAEQVKLALEVIGLQEQGAAVGLGDGDLRERRASGRPFDPSRRPCGPPQAERERRDGIPLDEEQEEGGNEEEDG